jgi:hypothetical protein
VEAGLAAPILRDHLMTTPMARPYLDVTPDSPLDDSVAEAPRHPVFRLNGP